MKLKKSSQRPSDDEGANVRRNLAKKEMRPSKSMIDKQVQTSFSLSLPEQGEGQGEGSFLLKPRDSSLKIGATGNVYYRLANQ
jgi:hypothetical protein